MNKKVVIIASVALVIDQIVKYIIETLNVNIKIINNILNITYTQNNGAAFSILEGKILLLIIISLIMLAFIYKMSFSYKESKLKNIAFGILIGGILGNLVDRIIFKYVRDFIDIKIFGYDFPIFNIADTLIVLGIFLLVILTFKGEEENAVRSK